MDTDQKINKIYRLLQHYDGDILTGDECVVRIEQKLMENKLEHLRRGEWVANWSFGCSTGEVVHTYALMDHSNGELWYYPFTFLNVIRFFWNRAMRWLGWHRWTKVG